MGEIFRGLRRSLHECSRAAFGITKLQHALGLGSRSELLAVGAFFVLEVTLKIWAVFFFRFDSDEPQHLHVVWAWTHNLVQYRDVFDNHMPLFQLLCAPILGLLGEGARDLYAMRLLMLPLFLLSMWCIFRIGRLAFSARVGTWSALTTGAFGRYFLCTTEFRTDDLWLLFWLLAFLTLVRGALRWRQAMAAGLLLGLAFAVSMKSTLLLFSLIVAATMTMVTLVPAPRLLRPRMTVNVFTFLVATAAPPFAIIAFFTARGVWPDLRYCVFEHNLGSSRSAANLYAHLLLLPAALPILFYLTREVSRAAHSSIGAFRRAFLCSACGSYIVLLHGLWHHITRQDYLPLYPLVAILVVASISALQQRWQTKGSNAACAPRFSVGCFAMVLLFLGFLPMELPRESEAANQIRLVRDILALTNPGDVVLDGKGESVFRSRSVYEVFEGLTISRVRRKLMPDNVPERCISTRTCVVVKAGGLTDPDKRFIEHTYLPVTNRILVAGSYPDESANTESDIHFTVTIPATYTLIGSGGAVVGLLDGTAYEGERFLAAGTYTFHPGSTGQSPILIWSQAAKRHFLPLSFTPARSGPAASFGTGISRQPARS